MSATECNNVICIVLEANQMMKENRKLVKCLREEDANSHSTCKDKIANVNTDVVSYSDILDTAIPISFWKTGVLYVPRTYVIGGRHPFIPQPKGLGPKPLKLTINDNIIHNITKENKLILVVHDNVSMLRFDEYSNGNAKSNTPNNNSVVSEVVVDVSLSNQVKNVSEAVIAEFMVSVNDINITKNYKCVFWDYDLDNWSTEGCETTIGIYGDTVTCTSNHMTAFSVIFRSDVDEFHVEKLNTISFIGCFISCFALFITIMIYFLNHESQKHLNKFVIHLAFSVLGVMISFIAEHSINPETYFCLVFIFVLHYFIFVTFGWFLSKCILLHLCLAQGRMLSQVFAGYFKWSARLIWSLSAVAPAVNIAMSLYHNTYFNLDTCWLGGDGFYYTFIIPLGFMMSLNTILTIYTVVYSCYVLSEASGYNIHESLADNLRYHLKMITATYFLTMVSWIIGILSHFIKESIALDYMFCLLAPMQGLFILVSHLLSDTAFRGIISKMYNSVGSKQHKTELFQL